MTVPLYPVPVKHTLGKHSRIVFESGIMKKGHSKLDPKKPF